MSSLRNIEVEYTYPLRNPDALRTRLESVARFTGRRVQRDTYFVPAHRNFVQETPISDWLRIRETDQSAHVTFKHWHNQDNAQAVSADEFETAVEDPKMLHRIFAALDIRPLIDVEKERSTWIYRDVEIAIDDVRELGTFIELEAKGAFSSIDEAKQRLTDVLSEIGAEVGPQDFIGYPHLMLQKRGLL